MNFQRSIIVFLLVFILQSAACGPTIHKGTSLEQASIQRVAVLPAAVETDIRRERADYIRASLLRELSSSGYVLLDENVVKKICPDAECANRRVLHEKYDVDTFAVVHLKSVDRYNFGAAFYNTISGELKLVNSKNEELFSIEHTEREKGGLLFNSGQVIQGLISTFENTGDDSFNKLAERFAKNIALKLPPPAGGSALAKVSDVNITETLVSPLGGSRVRICVKGNSGSSAQFVVDQIRIPLREVTAGEYCGALLAGGLVQPGSRVRTELRSAFGVPAQQVLSAAPFLSCTPENFLRRTMKGQASGIELGCASNLSAEEKQACEVKRNVCSGSQYYVYRANSPAGPFEKVGSFSEPSWTDKKPNGGNGGTYAVVAISKDGTSSVPVTLGAQ